MSAVGTANSYASDISPLLIGNFSNSFQAPGASAAPSVANASSGHDRGPPTHVDLSDRVKHILSRASSEQNVADRLKTFVEQLRSGSANASTQNASQSSDGDATSKVNQAFEQLSGGTQASDESQDDQPVQPTQNFVTGLQAGGYSISAVGRASDGSHQIEIVGPDGTGFLDRRFGTGDEFSTFSNVGAGTTAQEYQSGNKEYINFSQGEAAATSVTASSDAGTVSATSAATKTSSVAFVVDFSTGAISMAQTEQTSVSTAVQISSTFSTLI
jgi:hypothetical protein